MYFDTKNVFLIAEKRACLPGIGRGDGWIIPMNIFIETEQFIPQHCTLFENLGKCLKSNKAKMILSSLKMHVQNMICTICNGSMPKARKPKARKPNLKMI